MLVMGDAWYGSSMVWMMIFDFRHQRGEFFGDKTIGFGISSVITRDPLRTSWLLITSILGGPLFQAITDGMNSINSSESLSCMNSYCFQPLCVRLNFRQRKMRNQRIL